MTGFGQDSDRRRARESGFDRHVVKPVGEAMLLAALSTDDATGRYRDQG